jgi:hypothetical protein
LQQTECVHQNQHNFTTTASNPTNVPPLKSWLQDASDDALNYPNQLFPGLKALHKDRPATQAWMWKFSLKTSHPWTQGSVEKERGLTTSHHATTQCVNAP